MHQGTFLIVIGPTGSGKSMLMKHVIALHPELVLPYSYTTRARRDDSIENSHYKFITVEEFKQKIEEGGFLEWAEYGGNYYGTLKDEVISALAEGKVLLKEMEVQGARQVKTILPTDQLKTVFIDAGSWDELEKRVLARAHMDEVQLASRKQRFEDEITFKPEADVVIDNSGHDPEIAKKQFADLIQSALN
jgi:guanylate kinase